MPPKLPPFERPHPIYQDGRIITPDPDYVADLERERAQEIARTHLTRRPKLPAPKRTLPTDDSTRDR